MSRRRFRIGKYPVYDQTFDAEKQFSIKNTQLSSIAMNRSCLAARWGCESLKCEIQTKIQERSIKVKELEDQFEHYQAICAREGRIIPQKLEDVSTIFEDWLQAAARPDIAQEEEDYIQEKLQAFIDAEQLESDARLLEFGPRGIGKLRNGQLCLIDGQNVSVDDKGVLIINDERSPFHLMSIEDYKKHVIGPWQRERT